MICLTVNFFLNLTTLAYYSLVMCPIKKVSNYDSIGYMKGNETFR